MRRIFFVRMTYLYLVFTFLPARSFGQEKQVDSLFSKWNNDSTPGYAVGIIRDNKLVYARGYGMANLEYHIPVTPSSPFYIGSMSKQFTAACLLLLEEQGKVNLTDNIRKYLPELPDYKYPVTIENLLHHTSGIREAYSLMLFRGDDPRYENHFDNDDVLNLLSQQKELNFPPGENYNYSSGGFILLTKIIERVTGLSLREFAGENLFKPLGMKSTFYNDNYAEIIPYRAESYRPVKDGYERFNKNFNTYGDGGLITTVEDLARWDNAFYEDKLGIKDFGKRMYRQGTLKNGKIIDYAWALQVRSYNGRKTIEHNGAMLGFSVDMVRFPDEKFTAIVMSNSYKDFPTYLAYKISDIYLGVNKVKPDAGTKKKPKFLKLKRDEVSNYAGNYWNVNKNYYNRIDFHNDTLFYDNTDGFRVRLLCVEKDSFQLGETDMKLSFFRSGKQAFMNYYSPNSNSVIETFEKYDPQAPVDVDDLRKYVGTFYSDELKTTYRFSIEGDKFYWQINYLKKKQLFPAIDNIVWNSKNMVWAGFAEIMFQYDDKGYIAGLKIGDSRVKGVFFKKQ
jgi:CubicO group peptidase (beta-lactamase class C family)